MEADFGVKSYYAIVLIDRESVYDASIITVKMRELERSTEGDFSYITFPFIDALQLNRVDICLTFDDLFQPYDVKYPLKRSRLWISAS